MNNIKYKIKLKKNIFWGVFYIIGSFTGIALWIIEKEIAGVAMAIIFAIFALPFFLQTLPYSGFILLDSYGVTICSLYRKKFCKWTEISELQLKVYSKNKRIFFNTYSRHIIS